MPRYFIHHRVDDRLIWDGAGLELPDLGLDPDPEWAEAMLADILSGRLGSDGILVVTNTARQVLFVATS